MDSLTITIEPDALLGLRALAEMARAASGAGGRAETSAGVEDVEVQNTATALVRDALAAKLNDLGLSWAPSPGAVAARAARVAQSHAHSTAALRALARDERVKRYGTSVLLTAALVALLGGYIGGWSWTGFPANNQVWDWLNLLLLPVVIATVPIWLLHAERMSPARRRAYGVFVVAFAGFVLAGYLIPLSWTGFRGNTLWNWFVLLVLPLTLVVSGAWSKSGRTLRPHHKATLALLTAGWIVTLVGGYVWAWKWTGFEGNTLWDWLQLLLLPLVLPTILLPATLKWISGNAAEVHADAAHAAEIHADAPHADAPHADVPHADTGAVSVRDGAVGP
jgi:hypothetical protein